MTFTLGVISDTHWLLRPEAVQKLETCDAIIHAGDIGSEDVLTALKAMAPTYAVRGNVDWEPWTRNMPVNDTVEIAGHFFYIIHILDNIDLDPAAAGIDAVISGHTHLPDLSRKGKVLYMNPGSAGPRRFTKPVTMGKIVINNKGLHPEIINLS
ncbi:MAG: metallophosphoesterase family protein [Desulfobacteraceae bacterium]|jgi:putative phosphoesterase